MDKSKRKYFREKIGMFFRIPLDHGSYGYGQVATKTKYIFFDHQDKEDKWTDPEIILQKSLAFYAVVDNYVLKKGLWEILGIYPVKPEYKVFPAPFSYDPFLKTYGLLIKGKGFVPCSIEETEGRELQASWEHGAIEQRLRDYFAKRPCYFTALDRRHLSYFQYDNPATHHLPKFPTIHEFYRQYGYEFPYLPEEKSSEA